MGSEIKFRDFDLFDFHESRLYDTPGLFHVSDFILLLFSQKFIKMRELMIINVLGVSKN
jgi:hypothetical protein